MIGYFDFGLAVRGVKNGTRVAREGWNGAFLVLVHDPQPYLALKAVDGTETPWMASQADTLAEDWCALV